MMDDGIVNEVKEENINKDEYESSNLPNVCTLQVDDTARAFNMCIQWAEENIKAKDILKMKRLQ